MPTTNKRVQFKSIILVLVVLLHQCRFALALKKKTTTTIPPMSNELDAAVTDDDDAAATTAKHPVVIAGAGPAALVFAQRHLRTHPRSIIHIYEKGPRPPRFRDSPPGECLAGDFAFGFGFVTRGWEALGRVPGLEQAIRDVSAQTPRSAMANRRDVCAEMVHKLETEFPPDRIKIRFGCEVTGLNCNGNGNDRSITVVDKSHTFGEDENGKNQKTTTTTAAATNSMVVPYSLLVAADGTNSPIRKSLIRMKKIKGKRYYNCLSWKALQLPAQPTSPTTLVHQEPERDELCFVAPRFRDRHVMIYYRFNRKDPKAQTNPLGSSTSGDLKQALTKMFPDKITEFPSDEVLETFLEKPPGRETHMKLDKHAVPELGVALIGDAAVGTYVLFGHGCVSAMERANLLADRLAESDGKAESEAEALARFSAESVAEGAGISDLNLISHILRKPLLRKRAMKVRTTIQELLVSPPPRGDADGGGQETDGGAGAEQRLLPYTSILQRVRWTIRLSKIFWRLERRRAPL